MHVKNPALDPAVQQIAGALLLQRAQVAGASASQVHQNVLGDGAPVVSGADARPAIQQLLADLRLENAEQLANVTQADCMRCKADPIEAMALFALVVVVQAHVCGCEPKKGCVLPPRNEPLPTLGVDAYAGNYERPPVRSCPLILVFKNVAPTTEKNPVKLYVVNRSLLGNPQPIELPADLTKAKNGEYSFQADDAWMAKHKIRPGGVLELYQVKYDERGKPFRTSEHTVVKINPPPRDQGLIQAPALPPGDIVGNVRPEAAFRIDADPAATPVEPSQIHARLADGVLTMTRRGDRPAFEPFAKLIVENLATGKESEPIEVKSDGSFHLDIAAEKNHPILIRAIDHSHKAGDPWFERKLVLRAGIDEEPMLVRNPSLHFDAPPSLAADRVGLGRGTDCNTFISDRGITAGSIVTITRAVEGGGKGESVTVVAGKDGSLRARMPFEVHAKDVFDVEISNAFARRGQHELQKKATAKARFEVNNDGTLGLVQSEGSIGAPGTKEGGAAVPVADNSDHLRNLTKFTVTDFSMHFIPRDGNTGNGGSVKMDVDRRGQQQAYIRLDGNEVVVTMRTQLSEHHHPQGPSTGAGCDFASFGGGSRTWDNAAIGPIRQHMLSKKDGDEMTVRFENTDGEVVARGKVAAKWGTFNTGGHSMYINEHWGSVRTSVETHENLHFGLVPGSLVNVG